MILAFSQGDPAGIGPEILLRLISRQPEVGELPPFTTLLVAERVALEAVLPTVPRASLEQVVSLDAVPTRAELEQSEQRCFLVDPSGVGAGFEREGEIRLGDPGRSDAMSALAALDLASALAREGIADGLVTAPLSKKQIADWIAPDFRGHTDYLAAEAGCERYGIDYLMAFSSARLRVALLSTHIPLRQALDEVTEEAVVSALRLMAGHVDGRIAVAGLNPHAGEGGLLGTEDEDILRPAVTAARAEGIDAFGPESPDTVFVRASGATAQEREFDWVLALYHDQGLIALKSVSFGEATNWTLGLPYLRTSVDHGTAYGIAGRGEASAASLASVVRETLRLLPSA